MKKNIKPEINEVDGVWGERQGRVVEWMKSEGIAVVMLEDTEGRRDPSIRYLTGHPDNALFFLSTDKPSLLIPWDVNLAHMVAHAGIIYPYGDVGRQATRAIHTALAYYGCFQGSRVEVPAATPYPLFLRYIEAAGSCDLVCRDDGVQTVIDRMRAVKDKDELDIYRQVSRITCDISDEIVEQVSKGRLKTEMDVALFIEAEGLRRGCEGTSFETLAAGPERSFGIHAFPPYTAGPFATKGLSILDYGLRYEGYCSDVTLTFARGPLNSAQDAMLTLVEKAHKLALPLCVAGKATREIAAAVDAHFHKARMVMPHALGHGVGLEDHESPSVNPRPENDWVLEDNMIITLEPGLYDPLIGGCRLENDVLISGDKPQLLTNSRIIRL
jgi:Xaa-Pro dipeptidase